MTCFDYLRQITHKIIMAEVVRMLTLDGVHDAYSYVLFLCLIR